MDQNAELLLARGRPTGPLGGRGEGHQRRRAAAGRVPPPPLRKRQRRATAQTRNAPAVPEQK